MTELWQFVRVTTDDGEITLWQYKDCKTTQVIEKEFEEGKSDLPD